jgi:uncharacterized membrane protein YeiH
MTLPDFIHLLDLIGIAAFAATGALVAGRNNLDFFGALFLAFVTGIGGGTLRDLLLDTPVFWLDRPDNLWACLTGFLIVFVSVKSTGRAPKATINSLDAVGLAVFTVIGAHKALDLGYSPSIAVITGFLTGCGGGILRDVLANETPLVLAHKRLYATPSLIGGTVFVLLQPFAETMAVVIGALLVFGIRIGSLFFNWRLPHFPQDNTRSSSEAVAHTKKKKT